MRDADVLLERLVERASLAVRPVVLIDGRAGSGKSTLATELAPRLRAQLVRLDDVYPGWGGLAEASEHVRTEVLAPRHPRWREWDWEGDRAGEWHDLDPTVALIVEGVGSLTRENRASATFAVWLELDVTTRKERALARDGDRFAAHWDVWAAQEDEFIARENPAGLADVIL